MDLSKSGLILEGGGLRGVYTSGVLRFFMDQRLYFPYVIGVSMGACNAANYISRQPERNRIVNIRYVKDSRYMSYARLLAGGELFGMDFIFDAIPRALVPFDYERFESSDVICITVATDCMTGKALYFEKKDLGQDYLVVLKASSSLPFIAKPVQYRGFVLMDGGLSDSVPIRKSIEDGNQKHVLILTRPKGYRKSPSPFTWLARKLYSRYRGLCEAVAARYVGYNETMDLIDRLEQEGSIFVIRPRSPIAAGRIERSSEKLYAAYDQGYFDAEKCCRDLFSYLDRTI
ncbi:MAG: patatin family protein [Deltaproteobacteria bacterium]|nr:patatin family protein [Deltaproteobacteria bacterium]